MAWDFGSEEIKEMGQFLLRDGSGSVNTPHQQHTPGVGGDAFTRTIFYILHTFTQPRSPRASNTRCSSNINVLFHTTARLRSLSKISSPEQQICLPFLEGQHLLRSCPHFTDGEIESQRWDLTELRLQTCAPLLTHLHLISSSALTEGNINRSDSQTGQHP